MNNDVRHRLTDLLQQIAEMIVLDDPDNDETIRHLQRLIRQFYTRATEAGLSCAEPAKDALKFFRKRRDNALSPKRVLELLSPLIADIQIRLHESCEPVREEKCSPEAPPSQESLEQPGADDGLHTGDLLPEDESGRVIFDDPVLLTEFAAESRDHLDQIETNLLILETAPDDGDAINSLFRSFHSIKGAAACLRLDMLRDFAHGVEEQLEGITLEKRITKDGISKLLESTDTLREMIDESAGIHKDASVATPGANKTKLERKSQGRAAIGEMVRLDAERLDRLIDMIGELAVCESMVGSDSELREIRSPVLERNLSHLDKITREIQSIGMSLRMVPLRATFRKMNRMAHDLAARFNKKIEFIMSGEATEIDKSMVDCINDPLLHLVRNMVDHGIEPAHERINAGKPETGKIELRAYHQGSSIYIEISDDGRGLDYRAIAAVAIDRGLITSAENITREELASFVFLQGFSTARMTTDISGRGVGLDVVKRSIEMMQGTVECKSEPKRGTTFIMRLPLTLAIIDGLVVKSGVAEYIIPTLSVVRALRPGSGSIQSVLRKGEVMQYQDETIPVFRLSRLFGTRNPEKEAVESIVLIIEEEDRCIGLMVDKLVGKQQFAIKKVSDGISSIPGVSGCTIMPDGSVGLILGAANLITMALRQSASERSAPSENMISGMITL